MISAVSIDKKVRGKLAVCITGMPGAGKSTVAQALQKNGFDLVVLGDAVRAEAEKMGFVGSDFNLGKIMNNLRSKLGMGAVAILSMPRIRSEGQRCVIDGIRSIDEVNVIKKEIDVHVLAIHASPLTRYNFLRKRKRGDNPLNWESFVTRDKREIDVGLSEVIALSDEVICNNRLSIEELKSEAIKIVKMWITENEAGTS